MLRTQSSMSTRSTGSDHHASPASAFGRAATPTVSRRASAALALDLKSRAEWHVNASVNCPLCKDAFTQRRRRHHCRYCGTLTCDKCSQNRLEGERACAKCWAKHGVLGETKDATNSAADDIQRMLQEKRMNQTIECNGGNTLGYAEVGDPEGVPVLLVLGLDGHRWISALYDDFARRLNIRLICPDRPGRNGSETLPQNTRDATIAGADSIAQLCEHLQLPRVGLIGQSLGAAFALRLAMLPQMTPLLQHSTAFLVSPWVPLATPGTQPLLRKLSQLPLGVIGGAGRVGSALTTPKASEAETGVLLNPATRALLRHISASRGTDQGGTEELAAALGSDGASLGFSYEEVLHPVHVFHGRCDSLVPVSAVRWMEKAMPECRVTLRLGGTHSLLYDRGVMEKVLSVAASELKEAAAAAHLSQRRNSSGVSYTLARPAPLADLTVKPSSERDLFARRGSAPAVSCGEGWQSELSTGKFSPRRAHKPLGSLEAATAKGRRASLQMRVNGAAVSGPNFDAATAAASPAGAGAAAGACSPSSDAVSRVSLRNEFTTPDREVFTPERELFGPSWAANHESIGQCSGASVVTEGELSVDRAPSGTKATAGLLLHVCFASALAWALLLTDFSDPKLLAWLLRLC